MVRGCKRSHPIGQREKTEPSHWSEGAKGAIPFCQRVQAESHDTGQHPAGSPHKGRRRRPRSNRYYVFQREARAGVARTLPEAPFARSSKGHRPSCIRFSPPPPRVCESLCRTADIRSSSGHTRTPHAPQSACRQGCSAATPALCGWGLALPPPPPPPLPPPTERTDWPSPLPAAGESSLRPPPGRHEQTQRIQMSRQSRDSHTRV